MLLACFTVLGLRQVSAFLQLSTVMGYLEHWRRTLGKNMSHHGMLGMCFTEKLPLARDEIC